MKTFKREDYPDELSMYKAENKHLKSELKQRTISVAALGICVAIMAYNLLQVTS